MSSSSIYSSFHAAKDVARGACFVAWPADEPYYEPTLLVAHSPRQPRYYASANSPNIATGTTLQTSTSCPSLASRTSASQDGRSEGSISLTPSSHSSSCEL